MMLQQPPKPKWEDVKADLIFKGTILICYLTTIRLAPIIISAIRK